MSQESHRRVAIITGASSGIGAATARKLAAEGIAVSLAARRRERLEALAKEIEESGGECLIVETDVTVRAQVEALVEETVNTFGRVDILINNAGVMLLSYMRNAHVDEWEKMIDVNLKGPLFGIGAVMPIMREQGSGHIINVSSMAGRRVFPSGAVYCGTKFGLHAITEGLRSELGHKNNIRATIIAPGVVALICGVALVLGGVALIVVVMKALLRQATQQEVDLGVLRAELDEVV